LQALLLLSPIPDEFDLTSLDPRWQPVTDRYPALSQAFEAAVFEIEAAPEWVADALQDLRLRRD
jgi:predicted outer membrane protein